MRRRREWIGVDRGGGSDSGGGGGWEVENQLGKLEGSAF